jgi:uncharacterized protein YjcR
MEPLLDPPTTARVLGVSPRTLEAWRARDGGPPYVRIGALVRYAQADLERWLEGRRRGAGRAGAAAAQAGAGGAG